MNIAKDFAQHLADKGLGTLNVDIFYGDMPATPDRCIVAFEYEGQENENTGLYNPGLKIVVRSEPSDYDQARSLMQDIEDELCKIGNEYYPELASGIIINATHYLRVYPALGVTPIDRDPNNRRQFVQNYIILK